MTIRIGAHTYLFTQYGVDQATELEMIFQTVADAGFQAIELHAPLLEAPDSVRALAHAIVVAPEREQKRFATVVRVNPGEVALDGRALPIERDDRLYAKVAKEKGKIDVIFAAAGIVEAQPLAQMTEESFDRQFAVNTKGLAFTVSKALPLLNDGASIVLVTSIADRKGIAGLGVYSATKAALINMTKSMSKAFAADGILVNTVSPAFILTSLSSEVVKQRAAEAGISFEEAEKHLLGELRPHIELKRTGRIEEVGSAVAYLASESASFITGTNLRVDGGSVASV